MRTELLQLGDPRDLRRAARHLRAGRVVAVPTETVYGLAVRCDDQAALDRLRRLKQRPQGKEFSLLVASLEDACRIAVFDDKSRRLAGRFWPGPLTLVVPDSRGTPLGLRCPDVPATRELVRLVGVPLAAPSANLAGREPARDAHEVLDVFAGAIAAVLDGGPARLGASSTVLRVHDGGLEVLRAGALDPATVLDFLAD
jgi:L-threonylcarbamoyladenylate synthase